MWLAVHSNHFNNPARCQLHGESHTTCSTQHLLLHGCMAAGPRKDPRDLLPNSPYLCLSTQSATGTSTASSSRSSSHITLCYSVGRCSYTRRAALAARCHHMRQGSGAHFVHQQNPCDSTGVKQVPGVARKQCRQRGKHAIV